MADILGWYRRVMGSNVGFQNGEPLCLTKIDSSNLNLITSDMAMAIADSTNNKTYMGSGGGGLGLKKLLNC
jgi:hypothetical protein